MKKKLPLLFIVGLVGVLVLFCGCTSSTESAPSDRSFSSNVRTLTNGNEKISVEIIGTPYWVIGSLAGGEVQGVEFNIPIKITNVGDVGIKTQTIQFKLIDYAGFERPARPHKVFGMYPGETKEENVIIRWSWGLPLSPGDSASITDLTKKVIQDDNDKLNETTRNAIKKFGAGDLTLECTFGKATAKWTILSGPGWWPAGAR